MCVCVKLAVSLIILSIDSFIVVYRSAKTVEQIYNPYYLQCFRAVWGGGERDCLAMWYLNGEEATAALPRLCISV